MNLNFLRLPWHWRIYFALRRALVLMLRGLIWFGVRVRWPWLVFNLMSIQRKLGFRFERSHGGHEL